MKKFNYKGFFNRKGYVLSIFCCLAVMAVYIGLSAQNAGDAQREKENLSDNSSQEEIVTEQASANKNAPSEMDKIKKEEEKKTDTDASKKIPEEKPKEDEKSKTVEESSQEVNYEDESDVEETGTFNNGLKLEWPLQGEIVMDYSTDVAIYDKTLEQYRTNDSVSIAANEGTVVKAAGDGVVEFVGLDSEEGNMVVIGHNDGWKTTYSQLNDNILVEEGQNVAAGQAIGSVANPTKYEVSLGSHLNFKITRDDAAVDPKVALAE